MIHYHKLTNIILFFNFPLWAAVCQLLFLPLAAEKDGVLQTQHSGFMLKYLLVQEATLHSVLALCHTRFPRAGTTCGQLLHPRNKSVRELRGTNAKQPLPWHAQPPKEDGWHIFALCSAFFALFCGLSSVQGRNSMWLSVTSGVGGAYLIYVYFCVMLVFPRSFLISFVALQIHMN